MRIRRPTPAHKPFLNAALLTHFLVGAFSLYIGFSLGVASVDHTACNNKNDILASSASRKDVASPSCPDAGAKARKKDGDSSNIDSFFQGGSALVDREDFRHYLDTGIPMNPSAKGNDKVLVFYSSEYARPNVSSSEPSIEESFQQCEQVKIVVTNRNAKRDCIAVVGGWDSYSIHRFLRISHTFGEKVSLANPLRQVGRLHTDKGIYQKPPSGVDQDKDYNKDLVEYLSSMEETLERLAPIAKRAANDQNQITILVCNYGQSEFVNNFVCSARAQGIDLSHILLFATDRETYALSKSLGLHTFDVQDAFGKIPKEHSKQYGGKIFRRVMLAKVYCVHLINQLGYDLLFQDVDIVYYRDPLPYFAENFEDFDVIFQDDGNRQQRYAPYSPNSGLYYVRYNERTRYLFSVFSRMGDSILTSGSHQGALTALLNEHANTRGLTVKVLGRDDDEGQLFPGGYHYHMRSQYMKDLFRGKENPILFHMSWTKDKGKCLLTMLCNSFPSLFSRLTLCSFSQQTEVFPDDRKLVSRRGCRSWTGRVYG